MKEKENDISGKWGRHDGMTVPEGFFEDFARHMEEILPANPDAEGTRVIPARTLWDRVRPFVYLAAMFAGIWCMLKMFTLMGTSEVDLSVDNNKILTEALSDDNFIYDHLIDDITEREIIDEMYDDSIAVDEFIIHEESVMMD